MEPENYLDLEIEDNNSQWMKLVDYFNEFMRERFGEEHKFTYKNRFDDVHVISKKMHFIERLVNNSKIDREKVYDETDFEDFVDIGYHKTSGLTMILSIEDNPITLILNILK